MRILSVDGLRGFALILVLIFHTFMPYTHGGFIGVDIFFVLSGFLITLILIKEYQTYQTINFKNFYIRRFLRLAPALIIMVTTFYLYSQYFMQGDQKDGGFIASLGALFYIANLARAFDWFNMSYLLPTWSLSIEEQFYFIWPLLLLLLFRIFDCQRQIVITIISLILIIWLNGTLLALDDTTTIERLYFGSDTHSDGLLIGCVTAFLITIYENKPCWILNTLKKYSTFITVLAILFYMTSTIILGKEIRSLYIWYYPILGIVSSVLISSLYLQKNNHSTLLFSNKYLVWLGSISYGVYLWHWFIFRIVAGFGETSIFVGLYGSLIAIMIACLSYYFVEKPILTLKKHFYTRNAK